MQAKKPLTILTLILVCGGLSGQSPAQIGHIQIRPPAPNVIVPQSRHRAFRHGAEEAVELTKVDVLIDIVEMTATTTIEIHLENRTHRRQEAELIVPVPDGAVIRGFAYDGPSGTVTAEVLPRAEARRIYEALVAKIRDPALVEFIGYNLIRSSVFPIEAGGKQKVCVTYEHILEVDGARVDYVLPRTESLEYAVPWKVTATIKAKRPISTVYSPSHKLEIERLTDKKVLAKIAADAVKEPGPLRLSYMLQEDGVTASMFAYPDESVGGGYFLLLGGLPPMASTVETSAVKRELTLVIDRSGSMRNEKIEQVKEAALQIIAGLQPGEAFNIILYNNTVQWFSEIPVVKTSQTEQAARRYLEGVTATGGTNIYDALAAALKQPPSDGMLPIVLFLTDGLPTVGQTGELAIGQLASEANPHKRRIFTFGVGFDVNAPLLEKIASESRGRAEFVLPKEDVEVKVGKVFNQLSGPVLSEPQLRVFDADGEPAVGRTRDILPATLPDLFEGDRLILLGQYVGDQPLVFKLKGNYFGDERTFKFKFDFDKASARNGFVPRLWGSRKIAELIEAIRQMGADSSASTEDPKAKELIDEIVRLSTQFGILTEYTAFLAREGTDLGNVRAIRRQTGDNLSRRAMRARSGVEGVNQSFNYGRQKDQAQLNMGNTFYDLEMKEVSISNVQQINDLAYYNQAGRWIDSRFVGTEQRPEPARIITFGSSEFFDLARRLASENRQGSIAMRGEVLLMLDGEAVLIQMPTNN